ncbi:MAG: hypothetical protein WCY25_08040 [Moheibacter sp.]
MIDIHNVYKSLPFSNEPNEDKIIQISSNLLALLGIESNPKLILAPADDILEIERYFRIKWWTEKEDVLREKMHIVGRELDIVSANNQEAKASISNAWQKANILTNSTDWRKLAHKSFSNQSQGIYNQYFLRIAQQSVNRALRWEAIFPKTKSPYFYIYKLITFGVLPLGIDRDTFYITKESIFSLNENFNFFRYKKIATSSDLKTFAKRAFIAFEFRNHFNIEKILRSLDIDILEFDFGPVNSYIIPIEHQLYDRIKQCSIMLVIIDEYDNDFGLPIWIYQEIDIAKTLNLPIIIITEGNEIYPSLEGTRILSKRIYSNLSIRSEILKIIKENETHTR